MNGGTSTDSWRLKFRFVRLSFVIGLIGFVLCIGCLSAVFLFEMVVSRQNIEEIAGANIWTAQIYQEFRIGMTQEEVLSIIHKYDRNTALRVHYINDDTWILDKAHHAYQGQWYLKLGFERGKLAFIAIREGERNSHPQSALPDLGYRQNNPNNPDHRTPDAL